MPETIFEALRNDHQTQRRLIELVSKTHGDSAGRRELFERLKDEALAHAKVEERVLYSRLLADELSRDKAGHSVKEHHSAEAIFEELAEREMSDAGWLLRFKTLADELLHHMEEEEQEVFQLAGKVVEEQQQHELAQQFHSEKPAQRDTEKAS